MTDQSLYLPQECWELILNSLDHHRHLQSLSSLSHRFLSITNHLRHTLTITTQTLQLLPQLFHRFPNLNTLILPQFHHDLNSLLHQISQSQLTLHSLTLSNQNTFPLMGIQHFGYQITNLKELNCSNINSLQNCDLFAIGNSFPLLEVLDISYPDSGLVTDNGILALSLKLNNLRKINLSGNHFITDKSLIALSSNCLLLRQVVILDCDFITQNGIGLFMRNCRDLDSISVNNIGIPVVDTSFIESFVHARSLCEIDISNSCISDEMLCLVGEACLPLRKFSLSHCCGFTFDGISFLLCKYQSLVYLNLEGANFLSDECMVELCKFLRSLRSINLNLCSKLTNSSFYTLTGECSLLSEIKMERTNLGVEFFATDVVENPRVKCLNLSGNNNLSDEFIKKIGSICPSVQVLDVSSCSGITDEGIVETLKSFQGIRHLEMNQCRGIKGFKIDVALPKLEVLQAECSGMNDDALAVIGKKCHGLLHLDLQGCLNVTTRGVKEVVENCRVLREINLKWCDNVSVDIVAWMVFARPSLREIIPPSGFVPTENQRNFFVRHGCLVCNG